MLKGYVDNISQRLVEGWAIETDNLAARVDVVVFVDGRHCVTLQCDRLRADLARLGRFGDGSHGFRYEFPTPLPDHREHRIFVVFRSDGRLVANGHQLLPPAVGEPAFQPILVTAPGRSGTTLLMTRLAQQDQICVANLPPFELRMMSYYAAAYRVLTSRSDHVRSTDPDNIEGDRFSIGFNPFFHDDFQPAFSRDEGFLSEFAGMIPDTLADAFRRIILAFYQSLAADQGKGSARFFAEKTNNVEQNVRDFSRQAFGSVKELVLLRDPRDVYCSHLAYFKSDSERSFNEIGEACATLLDIWRSHQPDVHFIIYEDMISDAQRTFREVADFLGTDIFIAPDSAREADIFSGHATTGSPGASIGRWRQDLSQERKQRCHEAWRDFLQTFGFPSDGGQRSALASAGPAAADGP